MTAARISGDVAIVNALEAAGAEAEAVMVADTTPVAPTEVGIAEVEELPRQVSGPSLRYPEMLRQAGVEGQVVLDFVIDTTGHVEPASVRIISTAHSLFDSAARDVILGSVYTPARVQGAPVRVRVQQSLLFSIEGT